MSEGKSLRDQLLSIFGKDLEAAKTPEKPRENVRTSAQGRPHSQEKSVPAARNVRGNVEGAGRVKGPRSSARKKAAKKIRREGKSPAPQQPERTLQRPTIVLRASGPVQPAEPAASARPKPERPKPWQPPREPVLLVDDFGRRADGPVISDSGKFTTAPNPSLPSPVFRRAQERPRVQVGLDFGTSSTKAMWTRLGAPDRTVRAIDFGHGLPGVPSFCLPSVAAFDARGRLALGDSALQALPEDGVQFAMSRFKMLVAGRADSSYLDARNKDLFNEHVRAATGSEANCTPEMLTVAYLAFAMRRVRRRVETLLETDQVDIAFNTCVPVDQRENNKVFAAFNTVINAAERLELRAKDQNSARTWLEDAGCALREGPLPVEDRRLFLVPEAVAGTAAYVSSLSRESGVHALIDIGAGTTDVSIFNLALTQREGATTFWYSARSVPYGAGHIESRIRHDLLTAGRRATREDVHKVLSGDRDGVPHFAEILLSELDNIRYCTNNAWAEAYGHNRTESAWRGDGVKVFVAGGGALIPEALRVFSKSWVDQWGTYPCSRLPNPENYDPAVVGGPFVRVSVAYGLTIPIPELGDWVMPAESPDHTAPRGPVREWRQEGDQIVPQPGW